MILKLIESVEISHAPADFFYFVYQCNQLIVEEIINGIIKDSCSIYSKTIYNHLGARPKINSTQLNQANKTSMKQKNKPNSAKSSQQPGNSGYQKTIRAYLTKPKTEINDNQVELNRAQGSPTNLMNQPPVLKLHHPPLIRKQVSRLPSSALEKFNQMLSNKPQTTLLKPPTTRNRIHQPQTNQNTPKKQPTAPYTCHPTTKKNT